MNFVNDFSKQAQELFLSLTPAARMVAGLLVIAIGVSLAMLVQGGSQSSKEYLFGGQTFSDSDLKHMEMALSDAGLRDFERTGNRLQIPTTEKDQYLKALLDGKAFPMDPGDDVSSVIGSNNPFASTALLNAQIEAAREKTLSRIISQFPGVEWATVEYDERREGFAKNYQQTASVMVKPVGSQTLSDSMFREIGKSVANHFAGLKYENVRVTDMNAIRGMDGHDGNAEEQPYMRSKRQYEAEYRQKIQDLLANYGDTKVAVYVEVDPTLKYESEQVKFDDKPVPLASSTSKKEVNSSRPLQAGRPGAEPNAFANKSATVASTPEQTNSVKENTEDSRAVSGHEATLMTKAPLVLTQVSTTIGVPQSYYSKAWSEQWLAKNPDKTAADIPPLDDLNRDKLKRETEENIQKAVAGMLPPVTEGGDRYAQVTVYDFLDLTSPPLPTISLAQTAMFWLGNYWQSLALLGVALVGLGMAYSLSKAQPTGTDRDFAEGFGLDIIVEAANAAAQAAATASDVEDGESERQKRAFGTQSEDLKTELSSLINENPDAAANLLRSWIGQGT